MGIARLFRRKKKPSKTRTKGKVPPPVPPRKATPGFPIETFFNHQFQNLVLGTHLSSLHANDSRYMQEMLRHPKFGARGHKTLDKLATYFRLEADTMEKALVKLQEYGGDISYAYNQSLDLRSMDTSDGRAWAVMAVSYWLRKKLKGGGAGFSASFFTDPLLDPGRPHAKRLINACTKSKDAALKEMHAFIMEDAPDGLTTIVRINGSVLRKNRKAPDINRVDPNTRVVLNSYAKGLDASTRCSDIPEGCVMIAMLSFHNGTFQPIGVDLSQGELFDPNFGVITSVTRTPFATIRLLFAGLLDRVYQFQDYQLMFEGEEDPDLLIKNVHFAM